MPLQRYYIGLISGTSVDGIDAALIQIDEDDRVRVVDGRTVAFDTALETALRTLIREGRTSLAALGRADTLLGRALADACSELLDACGRPAEDIVAIGSHGQTVWHDPDHDAPCTLQIGDPNIVAERTGIDVVADFRRRDLAASGQAAPLVPPFHAAVFASNAEPRAIVNLGGIANLTVFDGDVHGVLRGDTAALGAIRGFDSGPANALLDAWYTEHHAAGFDRDGQWARGGTVSDALLNAMLDDPYFTRLPPKSTGKETFNLRWLQDQLDSVASPVTAQDVQTTLAELSAVTVARAVASHAPDARRIVLCGGGVHNRFLCDRLAAHLPDRTAQSASALGIDPDLVEAAAFAWLAHRRLHRQPGAFASVTGATGDRILGAVYPGQSGRGATANDD